MARHSEYDQVNKILKDKKRARRKKRLRRFLFVLLLGGFLYFLASDISKIQIIEVEGNYFVETDDILDSCGVQVGETFFFYAYFLDVEESILELTEIQEVTIECVSYNAIQITVSEALKIAYQESSSTVALLSESGSIQTVSQSMYDYSALIQLKNFDDDTLEDFASEFYQIPSQVRSLISDIEYSPLEGDESRVIFYMNDGKVLYVRIEDMVEQLDGDSYAKLLQIFPDNKYYDLVGKYSYVYD
ncbi:cell division protein FtsQ/DivIB [Tannockella kyphosi]|uniref:cell division protein FtsQ/DivIB n=1 Tax=Tannockella kyphosi TaxID=2899121 RepID=UPI0020129780|nr:FtsQ-type POTRA domain-containing protein [Tannockella kyphosi]